MNPRSGPPVCPRCGAELERVAEPASFLCPGCGGQAVALGQLRRQLDGAAVNGLWQTARVSGTTGPACPSCTHPTAVVTVLGVELDVCRACQWVWFDAGERARLPGAPPSDVEAPEGMPPEAARALARLRADEEQRRRRKEGDGFWLVDLLDVLFFWWP